MNTSYLWNAIAVGLCVLSSVGVTSAQSPEPPPQHAALTVKKMCCAKESIPAIKALSKVPGVKKVSVNYKTRTLSIERSDIVPSPREVWDAVDKIKIEPVRLATPEGIFTARPLY